MKAGRPILLVVDDEPEVLRSVYDLFRLDYEVLTTTIGTEAEELLRTRDVAVILSDQRMAEMSGVELLRRAREIRPEATRLLFTGYADINAVIDAINQGHIFRYISKPWDVDELVATLRQAIERNGLIVERNRLLVELERKNAELAEANRLKDRFLEVASHELNTPVGVVLGLAELWTMTKGDAASASERQWMERIRVAGHRLANIVERMLQLIRSGRFEGATLDRKPTELAPLVKQAIEDLEPFRVNRRQTIVARIDPKLGWADIDRSKILDLLTHLLINAIKFTPDGGEIEVEAMAAPDGADAVLLRISDRGVGIKPEDQKYLFEPFFTGNDTRYHSSGDHQFGKRGIGLGLCLVRAFATLHGGSVNVQSEPDQGSTFEVLIPRRAAQGDMPLPLKGGNEAAQ